MVNNILQLVMGLYHVDICLKTSLKLNYLDHFRAKIYRGHFQIAVKLPSPGVCLRLAA